MAKVEEQQGDNPDREIIAHAERTRHSLIAKLNDWEDQKAWTEFYQTYWKLIYSVAIKSGLTENEAFDCVQETILAIAKQSKKNAYDVSKGSFKSWLMTLTRWRITDQFRARKKHLAERVDYFEDSVNNTNMLENLAANDNDVLGKIWESEWQKNLLSAALAAVRQKVSPKQYQIFDCYALKQWNARKVVSKLKVSLTQVYLAKHRVGQALKKELARIEKERNG